ncbi:MAG: hypothetical protein IJG97_05905 [Bacilli bacterium]|nr:hypothetical protein [Bacilli bacterium]MBQ7240957.1 hypothetical protein [Bacilli bacterium]
MNNLENSNGKIKYLLMGGIGGFFLIICFILFMYKANNVVEYQDLSKLVNVDLNDLYIKGRRNDDFILNGLYGEYGNSNKSSGLWPEKYIYYDANGNEKLNIEYQGSIVKVNGKKYLFEKNDNNKYKYTAKEIYPDKNKNDCEKLLYNIIKLYDNDDEYSWYNLTHNNTDAVKNYKNGVLFSNYGFTIRIYEYENGNNSIDDDYVSECKYVEEDDYKFLNNYKNANGEVSEYVHKVVEFNKYYVIKYNNLLITISYISVEDPEEKDNINDNIKILEDYLKKEKII